MPECRIRVVKYSQNLVPETLQFVRSLGGMKEVDRAVRVIALALAQSTRPDHLVISRPQALETGMTSVSEVTS
jgi:hypothetical protein